MITTIKQMVHHLPIEEINDKDILLLKGIYKIPVSMDDMKKQLKYKKQWLKRM